MRKWGIFAAGLSIALVCLAPSRLALGAAETALHKVNTSVGVKNTAANQWKLETDPSVVTPDPTVGEYIITSGQLDNYFDPTQFTLNVDPGTGTFGLGTNASVAGVAPYVVNSFEVQTIDGGLIKVQDNGVGGSTDTPVLSGPNTFIPSGSSSPAVGGGLTGNVFDINFQINSSLGPAQPANVDQDFYDLFLTQIGTNPPGYDTTFTDSTSYIDVGPAPQYASDTSLAPYQIPFGDINASSTPEVSSASLLAIGGLALLIGRRKVKTAGASLSAVAIDDTPPDSA